MAAKRGGVVANSIAVDSARVEATSMMTAMFYNTLPTFLDGLKRLDIVKT